MNRVAMVSTELDEAVFLRAMLRRAGFPASLECIPPFARTVRNHEHFSELIIKAEPELRHQFYDAMRPHLRFQAKPLDGYVTIAQTRAESEQLPTIIDGKIEEFTPARDASTIQKAEESLSASLAKRTLTLNCSRCTRQQSFSAIGDESPNAVILRARRIGWVYDFKSEIPQEICPECDAR